MFPMLSLNLYPVFIAAAETGSMTAAAERLHLTSTAVSHSIRVLEEGLSTKLFLRSKAALH